ncbi:MAG TPA: hypothetical protein VL688_01500, partial [Verrucomicrobiae bacterium]|nr:hypothetical protein [Verrucomicrobiae bacterium]
MPTESEIPILKNQLAIAAGIWKEIEPSPHPADRWLGNYFHRYRRKMGSRDRRFFSEIIYGLFRNKMFLKAWSAHLEIPEDPFALVVLSALLEELIDPDTFRDTVRALWRWDWSAKLLPRFEDFKQGALPEIADLSSEEILGLRYSFPMWLVERWTAAYGEEKTKALFEIFHERPPLVVRTNPLKTTREELMARLKRGGFPVSVSPISSMGLVFKERAAVFNLEEFTEGLFEVQDAGSQ